MNVPASFASVVADSQATYEPPVHHLPAYAEGDDSPSFKDVLDTINPLQHIPIISTIYRELTGDQPGAMSRVIGSAIYGGPIGLAFEMVNSAIDDQTGKDVGGHTWAALFDDNTPDDSATKLADAKTEAPQQLAAADPTPAPTAVQDPAPIAPAPTNVQSSDGAEPKTLSPKLLASADGPPPAAANAVLSSPLPSGFMPVPSRRPIQVVPPVPPNITLSTSNQRSNVPVTGRFNANPAQTDARGIAVTQMGDKPIAVQAAVTPTPQAPANAWLPGAMAQALDKYERIGKLGQPAQAQSASQPAP